MNTHSHPSGPPGRDLLAVTLAGLAAFLGTPFLFQFVGPAIEGLALRAYGVRELADLAYAASFVLTGVVIFAVTRMALWYAISAIVAFLAMRGAALAV